MEQRPDLSDNPFLKIDNPFEQVNQNQEQAIEKAKEFQRLCHSIWHVNADGKALFEMLKDMYLMQQQIDPSQPNANNLALWWDGFKANILGQYNMGLAHHRRTTGVSNE